MGSRQMKVVRMLSIAGITAPLLLTGLTLAPVSKALAETCYQDDRGRIVTRRRPGYKVVDCPGDVPSQTPPVNTEIEPATAPSSESCNSSCAN